MNELVEEHHSIYLSWKQTQYSQPIYEKLVDIYARMSPDQKAEVSKRLLTQRN